MKIPLQPRNFKATNIPGPTNAPPAINLSWQAPVQSSAYATITGYEIQLLEYTGSISYTVTTIATTPAGSTSYNVMSGLKVGSRYSFRIYALSSVGKSRYAQTFPIRIDELPSEPTKLNVVSRSSDGRIIFFYWDAPLIIRSSPILSYNIEVIYDDGMIVSYTGSNATPNYQQIYLRTKPFASYSIRVAAKSRAGQGPFASIGPIVNKTNPPGIPTGFTGTNANGIVNFSWTASSTSGPPIKEYIIEQSLNGVSSWIASKLFDMNGGNSVLKITNDCKAYVSGLKFDTIHYFRIRAVDTTNGYSAYSPVISVLVKSSIFSGSNLGNIFGSWTSFNYKPFDNYAFDNIENFCVVKTNDTTYPYRAFFSGGPRSMQADNKTLGSAIYCGRSKDARFGWEYYIGGSPWSNSSWTSTITRNLKPLIHRSIAIPGRPPQSGLDSIAVTKPSVVYDSNTNTFYMVYSAVGSVTIKSKPYNVYSIYGATSSDAVNWTKSSQPLLQWSGEILTPFNYDPTNKNFYGKYENPTLVKDNNVWKIWFSYYIKNTSNWNAVGQAINGSITDANDFLNSSWTIINQQTNPVTYNWINPSIVLHNNKYYCASDSTDVPTAIRNSGTAIDKTAILFSESPDGDSWNSKGYIFDIECQHNPTLFVDNGFLHLYYTWKYAGSEKSTVVKLLRKPI